MRAVACDAFMHGAREGRLRPCADAGLWIGRDVGRIDHAERGRHCIAAGVHFAALGGVALRAIATAGERFSLRDQLRRETSRRWWLDRRDGRPPCQRAESDNAQHSECEDANEETLCHLWRSIVWKGVTNYSVMTGRSAAAKLCVIF